VSVDLTAGIVRIVTPEHAIAGTGFVVTDDGLITTSAHVVEAVGAGPGDVVCLVFHATGEEREAKVEPEWWRAPGAEDVAILRLERPLPEAVEPLPLGSSRGCRGHECETFGYPRVGPYEESHGRGAILGQLQHPGGWEMLEFSCEQVAPGMSGAPVLDVVTRRVIGMVAAFPVWRDGEQVVAGVPFRRHTGTNFAIPTEALRAVCPVLRISDVCPYQGLAPFTEADAEFFFGREKLVADLVAHLRSSPRFLVVVGPSGSGKSSVVQAGLFPALRRGEVPGSEDWHLLPFRPGNDPFAALSDVGLDIPQEGDLQAVVRTFLGGHPQVERLVLSIDQFEELFALCAEPTQGQFLGQLITLLESNLSVTVIVALRADFYGHLLRHQLLVDWLKVGQVNVPLMGPTELEEAVEEPARKIGLRFEPGLVETIVEEAGEAGHPLPLLESALTQLWERREDGVLIHASYQAVGRVAGAIGQWAEDAYSGLTPEEQSLTRRVFTRLVHYGEGEAADTRPRRSLSELIAQQEERETLHRLVRRLADARLLVTGGEPGAETVEIIHDALLREWGRLRRWVTEQREFYLWRQRLDDRLQEWEEKGQDEGVLLRGAVLAEGERWLSERPKDLNPDEWAYIRASVEKRGQERAAQERLRQRVILGLAGGLFATLILAVTAGLGWRSSAINENNLETQVAIRQTAQADVEMAATAEAQARQDAEIAATAEAEARQDAQRQADIALSRKLANQSTSELDKPNYEVALLLAIEAGRASDTAEAFTALRQAIAHRGRTIAILSDPVYGIDQANWNADGSRILTVGCKIDRTHCPDNIVRVWDTETGAELVTLSDNKHGISQAIWNTSGNRILTIGCEVKDYLPDYSGCPNSMVRVWNAETGAELVTLSGHGIDWATWNANESRILTASDDTVQVWNAETGNELIALSLHRAIGFQPRWNADESRILTQSWNTVQVWDAETGAELATISTPSDQVRRVVWNAEGTRFLTLRYDGTVQVWDAETGKEMVTLFGHTRPVDEASWNADGSRILTLESDSVRLWDAETGAELAVLSAYETTTYGLWQASWNAEGTRFLTRGFEGPVQVWDAETGKELVNLFVRNSGQAIWNATGTRILTGDWGKLPARLWDAESGIELAALTGSVVSWESWKTDGHHILTVGGDGTVRVWDAETGAELACLSGDTYQLTGGTWNDDGTYILTRSDDDIVRVWSIVSGAELPTLSGHTNRVRYGSWNVDGTRILTHGDDGTARLWDSESGAELLVAYIGQSHEMAGVGWTLDRTRVIARSNDGTVKVWDAESGAKLIDLSEDMSGVEWTYWTWTGGKPRLFIYNDDDTVRIWDVETKTELMCLPAPHFNDRLFTWNANGTRLLSRGQDGTARVWDIESGTELATLSGNISDATHAVWNPNGTRILIGHTDNTATIWDAESGTQLATLPLSTDSSGYTRWNADGTHILITNEYPVQVWDVESGARLVISLSYLDRYPRASWNAEGTRILTLGCKRLDEDNSCLESVIQVWDIESGTELITLTSYSGWFTQAVWNADETRLITLSNTDILQVWDVESGAELAVLSGHDTPLGGAVLNADETRLLTSGGWNGIARLWDVEYGVELFTFSGHVQWGDFELGFVSADESRLLVANEDGTVRQYYIWMEDLLAAACQHTPRNMTLDEWRRYMGEEEYRATCPDLPVPDSLEPTPSPTPSPTATASPSPSPIPSPTLSSALPLIPTLTTQPFVSPLPAPMESPLRFSSPFPTSPP